ncbi:hypothetical protein VUR80DRAFT_8950 [Thermomyces stellatus]
MATLASQEDSPDEEPKGAQIQWIQRLRQQRSAAIGHLAAQGLQALSGLLSVAERFENKYVMEGWEPNLEDDEMETMSERVE